MLIHVVDSFFGLLEIRLVTVFDDDESLMMMNRGRVRVKARVKVRARTRNGGSAARCSNKWSWP